MKISVVSISQGRNDGENEVLRIHHNVFKKKKIHFGVRTELLHQRWRSVRNIIILHPLKTVGKKYISHLWKIVQVGQRKTSTCAATCVRLNDGLPDALGLLTTSLFNKIILWEFRPLNVSQPFTLQIFVVPLRCRALFT